jgi:hypothetical protein
MEMSFMIIFKDEIVEGFSFLKFEGYHDVFYVEFK